MTTAAPGWMSGHALFLHWGVIQISLPNFLVILVMIILFVLALVLPFPSGDEAETPSDRSSGR